MPAYVIYHLSDAGDARRITDEGLAERMTAVAGRDSLQLPGMWIVQSSGTSDQIRDELRASIGPADGLLVLEIGQDAAWAGVSSTVGDWLLDRLSA